MSTRQPYLFTGRYVYDGVILPFGESRRPTVDNIKRGTIPMSDVMISTYPRCGTARLIEIAWQLLLKHYYPDNYKEMVNKTDITRRYVFIEDSDPDMKNFEMDRPIIHKTHLPYSILKKVVEQNQKIIVGIRNFKDCLVSVYHFYKIAKLMGTFHGTWDEFFGMFQSGDLMYGSCVDWVCEWWQIRDRGNILCVSFEDLSLTPCPVIKKMASFLGIQNITDDEIERIANGAKFDRMKANPKTNFSSMVGTRLHSCDYLRKGAVGDWKNYFTQEQNAYVDELYERKCVPIGLEMKFE